MLKLLIVIIVVIAFGATANHLDVNVSSVDGLILGLPWMFIMVLLDFILD